MTLTDPAQNHGFSFYRNVQRPILTRFYNVARAAKIYLINTPQGLALLERLGLVSTDDKYRRFLAMHPITETELLTMRDESSKLAKRPLISIVVPTYNPKISWLKELVHSIRGQCYPTWELCIADDASPDPQVVPMLRAFEAEDSRIRVVYRKQNGHISEATNSALQIAHGEFIAFIDHDDLICASALFKVARFLNQHPDTDLLYSNEDKLDAQGRRCEPTFKPEWSPDYFHSFMYLGHLAVYRRSLVERAGGFRMGVEGSQDYDLALRAEALGAKIRHLPKILYHWRKHPNSVAANPASKPYAFAAALKVHEDALRARGEISPRVETTPLRGIYRPRYSVPPGTKVLLCPWQLTTTTDPPAPLESAYPDLERAPLTATFTSGLLLIKQFLLSSTATYVLLVEESLKPITPSWVEDLLEQAVGSNAAAVGPKILSLEKRVLHAGYSILPPRLVSNFYGASATEPGYAARLVTTNNVSALSTCCLLAKREVLIHALEGEYTTLPAWETALSLALGRHGYLTWTPHVLMQAPTGLFAAQTDLTMSPEDYAKLNQHYQLDSFCDPFYPRGLDRERGRFALSPG